MILEKGDMWDVFDQTELFLITTNPIRRNDGAVVMGRGIAKQAKDRFPRLPYDFGNCLRFMEYPGYTPEQMRYTGLIDRYGGTMVGYFMVKDHWREPAKLSIIEKSVDYLLGSMIVRDGSGRLSNARIDLNFPGIGNGKLTREDVLPLLERLPDNVHIWEYEREQA